MGRLTLPRIAQGAVGLLMVIVLRALGELLRIGGCGTTPLSPDGTPYVAGAMAAAAAALITFALHASGRDHAAIGVAVVSIVALLTYKIFAIG
jgi:hypothetical protein